MTSEKLYEGEDLVVKELKKRLYEIGGHRLFHIRSVRRQRLWACNCGWAQDEGGRVWRSAKAHLAGVVSRALYRERMAVLRKATEDALNRVMSGKWIKGRVVAGIVREIYKIWYGK